MSGGVKDKELYQGCKKLLPFGIILVFLVANIFLIDLSSFANARSPMTAAVLQSRERPQYRDYYSLQKPRILIAIASYDLNQYQYLDRLMDSVFYDVCIGASVVDIVIYTTVVWPVSSFEGWVERSCGMIEIRIKSPSWKKRLVNFHRELFYEKLNLYDLFIYTEDDHLLQPRHIFGFLKETEVLKTMLGEDRYTDYSIGFLRYEEHDQSSSRNRHQENLPSSKQKVIWEHPWDLSSLEGFKARHVVELSGINSSSHEYFNGGDLNHQGMFMATPHQLLAWKERRPDCRFNTTWFLERPGRREKVSSLHLFSEEGCNVTQLIPMQMYQDYLIHHMPNNQHKGLDKYLPKDKTIKLNTITADVLGVWLRKFTNAFQLNKSKLRMYNDETKKDGPELNLSEFKTFYGG